MTTMMKNNPTLFSKIVEVMELEQAVESATARPYSAEEVPICTSRENPKKFYFLIDVLMDHFRLDSPNSEDEYLAVLLRTMEMNILPVIKVPGAGTVLAIQLIGYEHEEADMFDDVADIENAFEEEGSTLEDIGLLLVASDGSYHLLAGLSETDGLVTDGVEALEAIGGGGDSGGASQPASYTEEISSQ